MTMDVNGMRAPLTTSPRAEDMLSRGAFGNSFASYGQVAALQVNRRGNGYTVEIPAAGFKPDSVTLDDGVLTVSGQNDKRQFTRLLLLPEDIEGDNIQAKVEHGLLTLTLNMHLKAQPKKIEVAHN